MQRKMERLISFILCLSTVSCDIYLHNPRGSNNRLDESSRDRRNANRLFDSQNNARGGYNVGSLYYFAGSKLPIEWTNQHSCAGPNNHCELIIQYMCGDLVRDGATTSTIPENPVQCKNYDCNKDTEYGMHEDYAYYLNCKLRQRNKGLFTADQNLRGRDRARNTRQNPGGTRRGYECPEERDYYPYWHPSPWKDIAVMTNDATRCPYYEKESENVKGRWACYLPYSVLMMNQNKGIWIPNNKKDCEAFRWPKDDENGIRGVWKQYPSHNLPAPECRETEFTRDNHLGNGLGGYPNMYKWTVPELPHERCVMRIRYNISTQDYEAWDGSVNASHSKNSEHHGGGKDGSLPMAERYGFRDEETAKKRGYEFKNNPEVRIFEGLNLKLRLAINTAQFGRTFEDRSHTFAIRSRPDSLAEATIHNVNVRGKRGNIVQVYPAVEYDFVPNTLEMSSGDHIHYQWTGSNTNPHNNDGQGRAGTDRSNVVMQGPQVYNEGSAVFYEGTAKYGHWGRSYPDTIKNSSFLGLTKEDLRHLALLDNHQFRGEMSELDDAGTYFDLGPRKVTAAGIYHYLSTRNNNFSNRSQKGKIIIQVHSTEEKSIGWNGGTARLKDKVSVKVERGAFNKLQKLRIESYKKEDAKKIADSTEKKLPPGEPLSDMVIIQPEGQLTEGGSTITVQMKVESASLGSSTVMYRSETGSPNWERLNNCQFDSGVAVCQTNKGGIHMVMTESKTGLIVGIVVTLLVIAVIVLGTVLYIRKNPSKWGNIKRSMQSRV